MFRKSLLALSALTVIGAAALTPTTASAGWKHHHFGWGTGYYGYGYSPSYIGYTGYSTCWVKRWVDTPYGPRLKRFYVCY